MGDLDRRKHDVDIIERVLGGMREFGSDAEERTRVIDVEGPSTHSILELTVGIDDSASERRRRRPS